jgi:hypothetical protein
VITYRVSIAIQRKGIDPAYGQNALDEMYDKAKQQVATGVTWGKLETGSTINKDPMPERLASILLASEFTLDSFNLIYYKDHVHEGQAQQTMDWFENTLRPWLIAKGVVPKDVMENIYSRTTVPHDDLTNRDSW